LCRGNSLCLHRLNGPCHRAAGVSRRPAGRSRIGNTMDVERLRDGATGGWRQATLTMTPVFCGPRLAVDSPSVLPAPRLQRSPGVLEMAIEADRQARPAHGSRPASGGLASLPPQIRSRGAHAGSPGCAGQCRCPPSSAPSGRMVRWRMTWAGAPRLASHRAPNWYSKSPGAQKSA
jgi:hypothetical protein